MLNTYKESAFCWSLILVLFFGSRIQVSLSAVVVAVEEWVDIQESTVMTCSETGIIQLEWFRSALDAGSSTGATLIYEYVGGTPAPGSGIDASRYEFVGSGNFPLTIKSVELGDEGRYWCKIITGVGPDEDDGPLNIRVPVVKTTMNISYNGDTYTNEENIDIPAGITGATFNCTAPGIKPGATVFVWTLDNTTVPSTGPPTQSPNGANNSLTDSTSTAILDITDDATKPLRLCCATTNRQDGSSETEASICVTLNLIDPCQKISCENGGTCANENGKPKCHCTDEFTGDTCSEKAGAGSILYRLDVILACLAVTAVYMFNHGI